MLISKRLFGIFSLNSTTSNQSNELIKEVLEEKKMKQVRMVEKLGNCYNILNENVQNRTQSKLVILFEIAKIPEVDPKSLIQSDNE